MGALLYQAQASPISSEAWPFPAGLTISSNLCASYLQNLYFVRHDPACLQGGEDKTVKWETLEHSGVLFPPEYTPHGVKMLYDGKFVDLTLEQEEVGLCPLHSNEAQMNDCRDSRHTDCDAI